MDLCLGTLVGLFVTVEILVVIGNGGIVHV